MDLCWQSDVSAFWYIVYVFHSFLPRSKCLLISWLPSPSAVILEPKKVKSVTVSTFYPPICHEEMGPNAMILVFWMLILSKFFHSPFSSASRGSLVPLCFLPLEWYHLHMWGCWCFSHLSWFQLDSIWFQQMLAIWFLVPFPFLKPAWTSESSWFT